MILGLTGRARAGKSTVADAILEHCDRCGISCGIADLGEEIRLYCVVQGLLPADASKLACRPVPNPRYLDEIAYLRAHAGIMVSITRLNPDGSSYISLNADPNDPSETELLHAPADFYLVNTDRWLLRRQA